MGPWEVPLKKSPWRKGMTESARTGRVAVRWRPTHELRGRLARGVSWGRRCSLEREGWLPLHYPGAQAEPGCKGS